MSTNAKAGKKQQRVFFVGQRVCPMHHERGYPHGDGHQRCAPAAFPPMSTKIGATNSPITVKMRDGVSPMPSQL